MQKATGWISKLKEPPSDFWLKNTNIIPKNKAKIAVKFKINPPRTLTMTFSHVFDLMASFLQNSKNNRKNYVKFL